MAGRRWTAVEDEILRSAIDLTAQAIRELLPGRSESAVHKRRRQLGVEAGRGEWLPEEDEIIRKSPSLSAHDVSRLLPGRTIFAVQKRRQVLGEVRSRPANVIGSRTLLAKTCTQCGLLLDATCFPWKEATQYRQGSWASECRRCHADRLKDYKAEGRYDGKYFDSRTAAARRDVYRRIQDMTRDRADRHRQPWTEADERILDNPNLTLVEKAFKTGRTYTAVRQHCFDRGYRSKVGLGDAVVGQWRIQLPEEAMSA